MIAKLGVKEEELESFILDVYNRCIDLGLSPDNIALHIKDLIELQKQVVIILYHFLRYQISYSKRQMKKRN
jgi:hypothetical protein